MRKCAVDTKKLRKMTYCAIPHPPHLNVAPDGGNGREEITEVERSMESITLSGKGTMPSRRLVHALARALAASKFSK